MGDKSSVDLNSERVLHKPGLVSPGLEFNNNNKGEELNNKIKENLKNTKDLFGDVSELGMEEVKKVEESEGKMTSGRRTRIFVFFLLANIFLNYDTGVIPASLLEIVKEIPLDFKEQALIGSLVYLGLSFASLFVSLIFNKYGPAKVCSFMLIVNTLCCFVFSFSKIKYILFACRFMMGVSEAFIVIYGPVWVNNYSPPEHSTKWMGILHSCSALGVMVGYLVAGITINFFNSFLSWRFAIQLQGVAQVPIALYFYFEDEKYINVDGETETTDSGLDDSNISGNNSKMYEQSMRQASRSPRKETTHPPMSSHLQLPENTKSGAVTPGRGISRRQTTNALKRKLTRLDTIETSNLRRYCAQAKMVICNTLYICVTMGLCSMFFIVTGIQFWMTAYLIDILQNNPVTVVIIFSTVSITAPLAGVLIGGTFADQYGGYKGKNTLKALKLCCAFGVVAFVFAFPLGFLYSLIYITVLLWAFLFFGAAIVPVGTGIMVSSVRKDCQATSSSISQLIFNFFGYFLSPILTGFIMDGFDNKYEGFKWGMRLIFWWSIFAVIFMSGAWIVAIKKYKSGVKDEEDLMEDEMNQNMGDLIKLEIMRRMAQNTV